MKWLQDILAAAVIQPVPKIADKMPADNTQLEAVRDYWRREWEGAPGMATAIDAGMMVLRCEREMKLRGMEI